MPAISSIGHLVLSWLLCREGGAGTGSELRKALGAFAKLAAPGALDEALGSAEGDGLITRARGKLTLTDAGREAAAQFLGVPAEPRPKWKVVSGPALLDKLLEPRPVKRDADGLRAALLVHGHALPADSAKSLPRAADALGWKLLGMERQTPFTRAAVIMALAERELGTAGRDLPATLRLLAARAVGARRGDSRELRDAVLRRWLGGSPEPLVDEPPAPDSPSTPEAPPISVAPAEDLAGFAASVIEAARTSPTGRFGPNKVFISHVFRNLGAEGDLDTFKSRLVEAHRAELLSLSRADLVEAMDPDDVRASETSYLSAVYHFVRLEPGGA